MFYDVLCAPCFPRNMILGPLGEKLKRVGARKTKHRALCFLLLGCVSPLLNIFSPLGKTSYREKSGPDFISIPLLELVASRIVGSY